MVRAATNASPAPDDVIPPKSRSWNRTLRSTDRAGHITSGGISIRSDHLVNLGAECHSN